MQEIRTFAIQTLVATLILNAATLAAIYFLTDVATGTQNQLFTFWGIGAVGTLILWLVIGLIGRRLLESVARAAPEPPAVVETKAPITQPEPPPRMEPPAPPSEAAAVQMLAILQREGRLVDFLQENLSVYEDAQIGAAVRNIHEGSKKALMDHVKLEPVYSEEEGSRVTVESGFDTHAVRLTGNVTGDPPFTGTLRHRGWRVIQLDLPQQTPGDDEEMIVAPAEVEVTG
jgi:hypothetical protein